MLSVFHLKSVLSLCLYWRTEHFPTAGEMNFKTIIQCYKTPAVFCCVFFFFTTKPSVTLCVWIWLAFLCTVFVPTKWNSVITRFSAPAEYGNGYFNFLAKEFSLFNESTNMSSFFKGRASAHLTLLCGNGHETYATDFICTDYKLHPPPLLIGFCLA